MKYAIFTYRFQKEDGSLEESVILQKKWGESWKNMISKKKREVEILRNSKYPIIIINFIKI